MNNITNFTKARVIAIGSSIIGWGACAYLYYRMTLLSKGPTAVYDFCNSILGSSCDNALSNKASWQLGYPIASIGMIYFGILSVLLIIHKPNTDRLVALLASVGLGFSIIMCLILNKDDISCPLCWLVHIMNLIILVSICNIFYLNYSKNERLSKSTLRNILKGSSLLLLIIIISGFSEVYIVANSIGTRASASLNQSYDDFLNGKIYYFPEYSDSPMTGSPTAPLQLVVYSSFQCPGCQEFSQSLESIKEKYNQNINIVYKNFPLSTTCNSELSSNMQPHSCDAALAAMAADNQGKYWEYHNQLFQTDLQATDSTLKSIATILEMNLEAWEADRQSESSKLRLAEDINLANSMNISATPSVFLNGHKVNRFDEASLTYLLHQELNRLYKN
jgi:protein-disulfide isomerase/uncharacterized membrane protein